MVSLLPPPPFHPAVAERCIDQGTHLVTASYVSDEMRALHGRAKASGVILLNEMGLDPGIDHMSAMELIDKVLTRTGRAFRHFPRLRNTLIPCIHHF